MSCFHRFHVMHCGDDRDKIKYAHNVYPLCFGSSAQAKKSVLKKTKPFCSRCGRSELDALGCVREPLKQYLRPCNTCKPTPACIKHNVSPSRTGKKKKLKNKNLNTECILIPPISPSKRKKKKKRTCHESTELRSPCSILSLQNKLCLINSRHHRHHHSTSCPKYYPNHPRIRCDRNKTWDGCYKIRSCTPCRKNMATNTSAILEPKCVQIRKKINEVNTDCCDLEPRRSNCTVLEPEINNDVTFKCTKASKSCMCEPGCCNELLCNIEGAPCQRPIDCNDVLCGLDEVAPCQRQKCLNDIPCELDEVVLCNRPKCVKDLPCKLDEKVPCHRPKCFDEPPCKVDEYAPCQRPPKKRSKKTNTKAISRCWKLKKLPKIRRCIRNKCSRRQECCAGAKTCDSRNSRSSLCNCLRNLRTRSLTCCGPTKQTQVSTIHDTCWKDPCSKPNVITKISCNDLGLMQTCSPNRQYLSDCGIRASDSLLQCYLKRKCYNRCRARRNRQKCCRCMLTCAVAVCCAPCFLIALSYWLLKYICSSCDENNNFKLAYPCGMPSEDINCFVEGKEKKCYGKYYKNCNYNQPSIMDCNKPYKCPILDDETLIINGREQNYFKKISFEQPCPSNYNLSKRPCFDGSCERPIIRTSRCCEKKSHPDPERKYNLYFVDERGWVIKPVSGGGDNNINTFRCNSPSPIPCPRRPPDCARCFKDLPCTIANAIECSYVKARNDCLNWSSGCPEVVCKEFEPEYICECPKKCISTRAFNCIKRFCRDLDNDRDGVCREMMKGLIRVRPTLKDSCCEFTRSACRLFRYILLSCFCCPIFFCFYCCHECCHRICCCCFC